MAVKKGDMVRVHFVGKLEDDLVFDSTLDKPPIEFTVGAGEVIKGLEDAIIGMEKNDKKTVTIQPEDAYGFIDPAKVIEVDKGNIPTGVPLEPGTEIELESAVPPAVSIPKTEMPEDIELKEGTVFGLEKTDGEMVQVKIIEVKDNDVVIEAVDAEKALQEKNIIHGFIREVGDETVIVDLNHPLAGQVLIFDVGLENMIPAEDIMDKVKAW